MAKVWFIGWVVCIFVLSNNAVITHLKLNIMNIQYPVQEGQEFGNNLFFNYLKTENGYDQFSWFPRPWSGNNYLIGFAFSLPENDSRNWDDFCKEVIFSDEFITHFWKRRCGMDERKLWEKVISFFGPYYDGAPVAKTMNLSGMEWLPTHFSDLLLENGVEFGSYTNDQTVY